MRFKCESVNVSIAYVRKMFLKKSPFVYINELIYLY